MSAQAVTFAVDGFTIAALQVRVAEPRGLVIALHGGGYDCRYWHHPKFREGSLLDLGAALGFDVLAIDRPGNAGSHRDAPAGLPLARQADLIFALIDAELRAFALPVFLIGHSMGGILALMMAADKRGVVLSAIDVAGVPVRFSEVQQAGLRASLADARAAGETHVAGLDHERRLHMFYGSAGSFAPDVVSWGPTEHRAPVAEIDEVVDWPAALPRLASHITLPLQWTTAREERSSEAGEASIARAAEMFAHNRGASMVMQSGSGHNISLHHVARAYHLRAFAFFDEVRARAAAVAPSGNR